MTCFNFDFTNPTHANVFAQMCALAAQAGVPMQMLGGAPAPTHVSDAQASAPALAPTPVKTYAPAEDVQCKWVQDGMYVRYTLADGKYAGTTSVRKTLNARLREAKAVYDASKKAYKFASKVAAQKFVDSTSALVTAHDIEAVRAKAQARAEKKAQRGA